ncbi:hypothetical protein BGZ51_002574 [Haplosporangium sp. Z 767]|nr:hypothetical protein BGZ51_002574 [Haplosporangium sp. Z 767]
MKHPSVKLGWRVPEPIKAGSEILRGVLIISAKELSESEMRAMKTKSKKSAMRSHAAATEQCKEKDVRKAKLRHDRMPGYIAPGTQQGITFQIRVPEKVGGTFKSAHASISFQLTANVHVSLGKEMFVLQHPISVSLFELVQIRAATKIASPYGLAPNPFSVANTGANVSLPSTSVGTKSSASSTLSSSPAIAARDKRPSGVRFVIPKPNSVLGTAAVKPYNLWGLGTSTNNSGNSHGRGHGHGEYDSRDHRQHRSSKQRRGSVYTTSHIVGSTYSDLSAKDKNGLGILHTIARTTEATSHCMTTANRQPSSPEDEMVMTQEEQYRVFRQQYQHYQQQSQLQQQQQQRQQHGHPSRQNHGSQPRSARCDNSSVLRKESYNANMDEVGFGAHIDKSVAAAGDNVTLNMFVVKSDLMKVVDIKVSLVETIQIFSLLEHENGESVVVSPIVSRAQTFPPTGCCSGEAEKVLEGAELTLTSTPKPRRKLVETHVVKIAKDYVPACAEESHANGNHLKGYYEDYEDSRTAKSLSVYKLGMRIPETALTILDRELFKVEYMFVIKFFFKGRVGAFLELPIEIVSQYNHNRISTISGAISCVSDSLQIVLPPVPILANHSDSCQPALVLDSVSDAIVSSHASMANTSAAYAMNAAKRQGLSAQDRQDTIKNMSMVEAPVEPFIQDLKNRNATKQDPSIIKSEDSSASSRDEIPATQASGSGNSGLKKTIGAVPNISLPGNSNAKGGSLHLVRENPSSYRSQKMIATDDDNADVSQARSQLTRANMEHHSSHEALRKIYVDDKESRMDVSKTNSATQSTSSKPAESQSDIVPKIVINKPFCSSTQQVSQKQTTGPNGTSAAQCSARSLNPVIASPGLDATTAATVMIVSPTLPLLFDLTSAALPTSLPSDVADFRANLSKRCSSSAGSRTSSDSSMSAIQSTGPSFNKSEAAKRGGTGAGTSHNGVTDQRQLLQDQQTISGNILFKNDDGNGIVAKIAKSLSSPLLRSRTNSNSPNGSSMDLSVSSQQQLSAFTLAATTLSALTLFSSVGHASIRQDFAAQNGGRGKGVKRTIEPHKALSPPRPLKTCLKRRQLSPSDPQNPHSLFRNSPSRCGANSLSVSQSVGTKKKVTFAKGSTPMPSPSASQVFIVGAGSSTTNTYNENIQFRHAGLPSFSTSNTIAGTGASIQPIVTNQSDHCRHNTFTTRSPNSVSPRSRIHHPFDSHPSRLSPLEKQHLDSQNQNSGAAYPQRESRTPRTQQRGHESEAEVEKDETTDEEDDDDVNDEYDDEDDDDEGENKETEEQRIERRRQARIAWLAKYGDALKQVYGAVPELPPI